MLMTAERLARRTEFLQQSEIRSMTLECAKVGGINMSQGVCDTPVPPEVLQQTREALREATNTYTRFDGINALRAAIAEKLKTYNQLTYDPETEIVVSSGSTGAFYGACLALLDPGDEVVLFEPFYGYHWDTLRAVGASARFVSLRPPNWEFTAAALEAAVTPRTKAIVVNTPTNPSGKVFSRTELDLVAKVAIKRDLFVITDEIYEHFTFGKEGHISPASIPGLRERTITISGFSKTLSVTGWRLGYSASPPAIAARLGQINDLVYICAPAPLQAGVASALPLLPPIFYAGLSAEYRIKRDMICSALNQAGLTPVVPEGAYYVLADLERLPGDTSKARVMHLLKETGVAAVPGTAFFAQGGDHLARFCFAKTTEELTRACTALARLSR